MGALTVHNPEPNQCGLTTRIKHKTDLRIYRYINNPKSWLSYIRVQGVVIQSTILNPKYIIQ